MSPIEKNFLSNLNDVGLEFLIRESFLGYKYRKNAGKLYAADSEIPTKLITSYYGLSFDEKNFDFMKKTFISQYIRNESKLEGLDVSDIHDKCEVEGLAEMYEYIHSEEIDNNFTVYTLLNLHKKLYSLSPFPDFGGTTRNFPVFLPETGTEICEWTQIFAELQKLDGEVKKLLEIATELKGHNDINSLLNYVDRCLVLKCELIKIHPFVDGNGRSVRGFINKLFENAGLPPVYIKPNERTEYHKAMNKANNEGDYSYINNFYRYKICDSIIELDINNRLSKKGVNQMNNSKCKQKKL